jgi:molybdenum cofactor cytidylyltransferase
MTGAPKEEIGIIVLAAGGSRRMNGRPKQLLEFKGNSLLKRAAKTALATRCRPVVIVLGAEEEKLRTEIENLPLTIEVNKNWKEGLGSSIKAGLSKLLDIQPDLDAAILTLCDQPLIDSAILERLVRTYRETGKSIVAAEYQDTAGVPALFSRGIFEKLLNLNGLSGAKSIIQSESSRVAKIPVPEAAIDIDSPQDHELLLQQFKR